VRSKRELLAACPAVNKASLSTNDCFFRYQHIRTQHQNMRLQCCRWNGPDLLQNALQGAPYSHTGRRHASFSKTPTLFDRLLILQRHRVAEVNRVQVPSQIRVNATASFVIGLMSSIRQKQACPVCNAGGLSVSDGRNCLALGKKLSCLIEPDLSVAGVHAYHMGWV
jgi:hypothetical protein